MGLRSNCFNRTFDWFRLFYYASVFLLNSNWKQCIEWCVIVVALFFFTVRVHWFSFSLSSTKKKFMWIFDALEIPFHKLVYLPTCFEKTISNVRLLVLKSDEWDLWLYWLFFFRLWDCFLFWFKRKRATGLIVSKFSFENNSVAFCRSVNT